MRFVVRLRARKNNMSQLFESIEVGALTVPNRIVMAPMTRSRADMEGNQAPIAATYYEQRASAGLLITEATAVSIKGRGYPAIPGIWNDTQVAAWRGVASSVHAAGGRVIMQLFHTGRIGHSSLQDGYTESSSAIAPAGQLMGADFAMHDAETPRETSLDDIQRVVQEFATAAANAMKAGFDGVELHAANGYLVDQFLRDGVNQRTDEYGGSIENRARFFFEVLEAMIGAAGPRKVGVRISPWNPFNSMSDSNPGALFTYVAKKLNDYPVSYLHIIEPNDKSQAVFDAEVGSLRDAYKGIVIVNGGYRRETAEAALEKGLADLVSFGVPFISNPDLVERLRHNAELTPADSATFYQGGEKGYIDYPSLALR